LRKQLPEYEPGGRSIGFTSSINLRLRRGDWITIGTGDNKRIIGQVTKYKTHKNKTYKQQQTGEFDFYFDEGGAVPAGMIDNAKELIILAIVYEVIERRGAWYYYKGQQIAQGEANAIELIRGDEKLFAEIKNTVTKLSLEADAEVERPDVFGTDDIILNDITDGVIESNEVIVIKSTSKGKKK
jgi:hypothetical protein